MSKFVLTAQLQLQAPNNVSQIVSQIQNQLNNVSVNVQVQGSAQANKQLQQITQSTNAATTAAGRMGNAFAVSIRRFAAFSIATRAVGLFTSTLADAVKTAIDFERELIKISQVTGRSVSSLRDLTDSVTSLATGLGVTSGSLLEVTTVLTQAGLSSDDTKIALESLAKAALAPNFDSISETAEGAIAILAQFKQGVGALEGQLSSIDAVAGAFAVEAGDLIDVIRRSGGVFKASGGSLNELLALFTSVRATTRESAESIGTGLRTIFTRIQRPETIEFLKQFGVELVDLNGKFVGPYEAIKRLSEAISGLGEGDLTFIKIAEELGGFRQIGKVLPLLQQFSTAQAALNVAQNAGNGLTKNAEMAQASLAIRIIKVREEFLALVRSVTETTTFQVMANTALALASALIKIADSIKPLLPLLAAVAAFKAVKGIGGFLGGIGAGLTSGKTFNKGGKVLAFAKGGLVPGSGSGTADDVPAMVSSGEFVMKKSAVQRIGANNLAAMNRGGTVQEFATGGIVVDPTKIGAFFLRPEEGLDRSGASMKGSVQISNNSVLKKLGLSESKGKTRQQAFDKLTKERQASLLGLSTIPAGKIDSSKFFRQGNVNLTSSISSPGRQALRDKGVSKEEIDRIDINKVQTRLNRGIEKGKLSVESKSVPMSGSISSYFPGKDDFATSNISNIIAENTKRGLYNTVLKSVDPALSVLNNPVLSVDKQQAKRGASKISNDPNARATTEGFIFEGLIKAITGAKLSGNQANFDFPSGSMSASKASLKAMFANSSGEGIDSLIKADAKRSNSRSAIDSIKNKIANDINANRLEGISIQKFAVGGLAKPKDTLQRYFEDAAPINLGLSNSKALSKDQRKQLASDTKDLRKLRTSAPTELYSSISRSAFDKFAMDTGLNKNPDIPQGTKFNNRQSYYAPEVAKTIGKTFSLPGFVSTSKNYTVAKSFLDNAPRSEDNWAAMLTIATKKNAQGVDVAEQLKDRKINVTKQDINPRTGKMDTFFMKQPNEENEFMLSPRSRFRVDKARYVDLMGRHNLWANVQQLAVGGRAKGIDRRKKRGFFFDFDDTLAETGAIERPGTADPYSDFRGAKGKTFLESASATRYAEMAKRRAAQGNDIWVLTARPGDKDTVGGIRTFGSKHGLNFKGVIGVAGMSGKRGVNTSTAKSMILSRYTKNYPDGIVFVDDLKENILAAQEQMAQSSVPFKSVVAKKNLGGFIQRFALGGMGKPSRKVDYESGVGPSPFASQKSNKLGQEVYALQKSSGLNNLEFGDIVQTANTLGYNTIPQFKQYLAKRVAEKKNKSQLKTNVPSLLSSLKDDPRPQATSAQAAMVQQLSGPEPTPQIKRLSPQAEKMRIMLGGKPKAFASGGLVPGVGNSDTVPATLREGDFVIRKSSVSKLGAENLASMAGYAAGGNVSKSVPALLTPGEFVFDEPSAKSIGYGNLNRMNKVGKYAKGGFVGVQKFATGTSGSGAKSVISNIPVPGFDTKAPTLLNKIVAQLTGTFSIVDIDLKKSSKQFKLLQTITPDLAKSLMDYAQASNLNVKQTGQLASAYSKLVGTMLMQGDKDSQIVASMQPYVDALKADTNAKLASAKATSAMTLAGATSNVTTAATSAAQPTATTSTVGASPAAKQGINVQQVYLDAIKADYKESFQQIKNAHDQEVKSAQASGKTQQEIANITNQYKQQVQQLNTSTIAKIKTIQASAVNASATAGTILPNTSSAKVTPSSGVAIVGSGKSKAGSSGAGSSQDAQGGLIALTLLPSIIQSMIPPIDENSSAITRMTNSLLSMATTVGGVIFALQSFGVSLNVDKLKTLLGTGSGSLGDIISGVTSGKQRAGESFKEAFQTGKIDGQIKNLRDSAPNRQGNSRGAYDATSGRFVRNDTPMEQLSRQSRADQIRDLRKQRLSSPSPTSVTGKFAQNVGKVSSQGGALSNATNAAMNSANFVGKSFQSVGSGIGSGVQLAASKVGLGNVASSAGAKLSGAMAGITQASGPLITNLVSLAGPLVAIGGSALVVSSVFNTLISSMYDYDNQLKKAISKGDVSKAGKVAGQKYELEAANTARTAGATVGAGIGFFLGGPIGSAIGATIGAGIGTLFANAAPGLTESLNILFGGNTKASAIALAEAQAQAVKTSQALAEAQTTAEKSIKDFQAGTITAAEALRKVQSATQEVNTLQQKNEKAVAKNNENKSTGIGSMARNSLAYSLGGALFGVETADTRNKRIDSENAKVIEGQKASILQANDINKQVGLATARTSILSSVKAGKTREEIAAGLDSQLGDSGPQAIRKQASEAFSKAMAANKRGDTETGSAYEEQAKALRKQAEDYEQSISNLIKEQERLEKSLQALNLGLRGPAAGAGAAAAELQNFAAQIEGTALPAVNAIGLLEASATSAGAAMDKASLDKANEQVASTLKDLGASPEQVTKFQGMSGAFNSAQVKYKDVAQQIKDEQSASGKSFSPEEIRKKFAEKLGEGAPEEFKNIINGIELTDAITDQIARNDYSGIADALGEQGKKFFEPVQKVLQDYQKAQDVVVKLTKERIEAERGYIQSVREAQDLMMEGREIQSKYGGPKLTIEERRASVLTKANASNSLTGLPALSSASGADFTARSQAIQGRFASNQQQINAGEGAGTKSGEQLRQQQQDLKQAQKDQIQTIRELVKLEEENLKLISEKNKLERDSIDSLVSGDIEKFFDQQAAVGAQAAIATGDQRLIGQFGMSALGGAAQETKRQQEAGVTSMYGQNLAGPGGLTERAYGSAISAAGVQNPLAMAQVAAGTTGEEEASKARLRELGGALGETGQLGQDLSQIDVATATMNVANAEVILNNAIEKGKALGTELMANGGMVYASRGIFVPRGTDTVPAMLTPGEFVVRREAVQRGNNLQMLQSMNRGSNTATGQSSSVAMMATGGKVRYFSGGGLNGGAQSQEAGGGGGSGSGGSGFGFNLESLGKFAEALTNFNSKLATNITNLANTKFTIKLETANINVNLTGASLLKDLTDGIQAKIYEHVGQEISQYRVGNGGKLEKNGSLLNNNGQGG